MSSGCFPCCPLLIPWKSKVTGMEIEDLPENELTIFSTTKECTTVEDPLLATNPKAAELPENESATKDRVMETYSKAAESSEKSREVIPTTAEYVMATGKQTLMALQSAAAFIPVPLIREAVGVALKIIKVCEKRCESTSVIGEKAKELKDRVYHVTVAFVETFTPNNQNGSDEVIRKAAMGIELNIKGLLSTLEMINKDLDKITAQGRWKLGIFRDLNVKAVDGCLNSLSTALDNIKLNSDPRDAGLLRSLIARLSKAAELPENEIVIMEDRIMETNSKTAVSSENPREVIPSTTQYIKETGKQALMLLQTAAPFIPVPLIKEAVDVALKIIEVCESTSVVGGKVKELRDRVYNLSKVISETFTPNDENGSEEVIVKAAKGIEQDIKDLVSTLETINKDLDEIAAQGRWKLGIFSDLNMTAVDGCLDRLSTAVENFKFASGLRDTRLLQLLHSRLSKNHVADKVKKIDDVDEDVKKLRAKTRRSATLPPSDTAVQQMPLKPAVFHGRDVIIEEITQLIIKKETSRVCILGAGGMGKTSVALGVVEQPLIKTRFLPENIVWVPCVEATSATLLLEILSTQLQIPGNTGQPTIEKIISLLATSTNPRLILLDNFETPYYMLDAVQKQVEDILRRIAMMSHVAILVTMRGRYPPCAEAIKWHTKEIQPTDEAACFLIYRSIHPESENDPDVGVLLGVLGRIPFAVTLMARLAKEGQSTAKELMLSWSEDGPDISDQHEQIMSRSISLSVDSNLMKQNPQALLLFNILSCLPSGTTKAALRWWVPALHSSKVPSSIATLFKTGLLVENRRQDSDSPVLFVLPVVQSFMQQHGRIGEDIRQNVQLSCSQYVLDHFQHIPDVRVTFSKQKALVDENFNIQAILCGSHSNISDTVIDALITFSWYRCKDAKPSLEIAKHAVSMAKAFGNKEYIASSLWCLGETHYYLGEFYAAYDHLQEAYQLYKALLPESDDRKLQLFCCLCGISMVEGARLTIRDGDKVVSLARDVEKQAATVSDDHIHARSLVILASVLYESGNRREALRHLERTKVMGIAGSDVYYLIAIVHYHEKRLPEALDAAEEAWKLSESRNSLAVQAKISFLLCRILFSANRDTEAWRYMELSLTKSLELGNRRDSARALEYMGYMYLRRGDYLNAHSAYEAAAESYLGTVDEEPGCTTCKDNMAKIKDMQRNPDLNVGFKRPRGDINWPSLYYPGVAASV